MRLLVLAVAILPGETLAGGIVPGGPVYVPPPSVAQDFERWRAPESPDRDGPQTPVRERPRPENPPKDPDPEDPKDPDQEGPPKEPCPPETNRKLGGGGGGC